MLPDGNSFIKYIQQLEIQMLRALNQKWKLVYKNLIILQKKHFIKSIYINKKMVAMARGFYCTHLTIKNWFLSNIKILPPLLYISSFMVCHEIIKCKTLNKISIISA